MPVREEGAFFHYSEGAKRKKKRIRFVTSEWVLRGEMLTSSIHIEKKGWIEGESCIGVGNRSAEYGGGGES